MIKPARRSIAHHCSPSLVAARAALFMTTCRANATRKGWYMGKQGATPRLSSVHSDGEGWREFLRGEWSPYRRM